MDFRSAFWVERKVLCFGSLYAHVDPLEEEAGDVDLSEYNAIAVWLPQVESLERFVPFQKTVADLKTRANNELF